MSGFFDSRYEEKATTNQVQIILAQSARFQPQSDQPAASNSSVVNQSPTDWFVKLANSSPAAGVLVVDHRRPRRPRAQESGAAHSPHLQEAVPQTRAPRRDVRTIARAAFTCRVGGKCSGTILVTSDALGLPIAPGDVR